MHYEVEMGTKDLKKLFKPFASIQNRILIDYKKLRDHILKRLGEKASKSPSIFSPDAKPKSLIQSQHRYSIDRRPITKDHFRLGSVAAERKTDMLSEIMS
jgi:hypothetical protein